MGDQRVQQVPVALKEGAHVPAQRDRPSLVRGERVGDIRPVSDPLDGQQLLEHSRVNGRRRVQLYHPLRSDNVLRQLDTLHVVEAKRAKCRAHPIDDIARLGKQLTRRARVAQLVGSLQEEADSAGSRGRARMISVFG